MYDSFMQELEAGHSGGGDWTELSDDGEEGEELEVRGGEQLDVLFEKERGVVRRAGWLAFKALLAVNKDRKLEVVARRKWRRHWVTLKGEKKPSPDQSGVQRNKRRRRRRVFKGSRRSS